MNNAIDHLVQSAGQAANAGRWDEAERLWHEVRKLKPDHPQALYSLGVHALQRGDVKGARSLLDASIAAEPRDPVVRLTLAIVFNRLEDANGEREAIESALAIEPYFLPGILAKAGWLERHATPAQAAQMYVNALKVAPPEQHWPPSLRPQLEHARQMSQNHAAALARHMAEKLAGLHAQLPGHLQSRWSEAISLRAGLSKPYFADCNQLTVPRLPAQPFFERSQFAWVPALEAKTDVIRDELHAALKAQSAQFNPYIAYNPGEPVNQWKELNHSKAWSAYHLWRGGEAVKENLDRCPQTSAALASVEMAEIGGLCPNAMFSALAPGAHIPPHHGETNARLVAHLPLIVPDGCTYRVGFDRTTWKVGEVLVFDDTIEHEAHNGSNELRVVMIFDVWNPYLAPAEREMVNAMAAAVRAFG